MNSSFQPHVAPDPLWTLIQSNFSDNDNTSIEDRQPLPYYGDQLNIYKINYAKIHGYLSLVVCLFGISANVLNIIVLTRKNMLSPINVILTGLAVSDMLVMFSYIPFAIHNYIRGDLLDHEKFSYNWAVFALIHANLTVVAHTISIWLTVIVAIWRFMAVCYPGPTVRWRGLAQARTAIMVTYVSCVICCTPFYLTFGIWEEEVNGRMEYNTRFNDLSQKHNKFLEKMTFWLFSVGTKLVPCVTLTALSFGLIRVLYEASDRRKRLKIKAENDNSHDRTTRMLLVVLFLFLVTEFPSGMLNLFVGILGQDFFYNVYNNLGETMDILALVNSAVNFIIYCSMSRQFRDTFAYLFIPNFRRKWAVVPTAEPTQTIATACV